MGKKQVWQLAANLTSNNLVFYKKKKHIKIINRLYQIIGCLLKTISNFRQISRIKFTYPNKINHKKYVLFKANYYPTYLLITLIIYIYSYSIF